MDVTGHGAGRAEHRRRTTLKPRIAEVVAEEIRRRIVDGDLADGALLPKQEELITEFGVSRPSIREAIRILESEGLLTVRRGNRGGAVVHRPRADNAAYVLELVLRSNSVAVDDVSAALRYLEPMCAAMCASRPDRETEVLPRLREIHDESIRCIGDVRKFTSVLRSFHEEIVACSGNQTMILIIGALERITSARAELWAEEQVEGPGFPDLAYRQRAVDDHEFFLRLIERGEADTVERQARAHMQWTPVYDVESAAEVVPLLLHPEERT